MTSKEYLQSLEWNSFSTYPTQGENIFLHCISEDGKVHRFIKVSNFNAVKFDFRQINKHVSPDWRWLFTWLPVNAINQNNVQRTNRSNADGIGQRPYTTNAELSQRDGNSR